jgi:hypothetical protein
MPGKTDRPGADEPGASPDAASPPGSQDALRRRLAELPASHPSSPWYRERRPPDAGQSPPASPDEASGEGPRRSGRFRSEESREDRAAREADVPGRAGREPTGQTAATAAGAARDRARTPEQERGKVDQALWDRAARWQQAADARRRAGPPGGSAAPPARREPFRPWFAESAGEELWLNAEGTGEPWFTAPPEGER